MIGITCDYEGEGRLSASLPGRTELNFTEEKRT
jgi:hypothetical protein